MSDSEDGDGAPPPFVPMATGSFRRLSNTATSDALRMPASPNSQCSGLARAGSAWERGQSFRLYAGARPGMPAHGGRRGTTMLLGESLRSTFEDIAASPLHALPAKQRVAGAYERLREHLEKFGKASATRGSVLPNNICKGPQLGEGGYAKVFAGLNLTNREIVAIKELRLGESTSREAVMAVQEEFNLLRQVQDPCIVRNLLFEYSVSQHRCRIVMEFMSGGSVRELADHIGPIPEGVLRVVARDIISGLSAIHREGIVHRDIKPANLLINSRGVVKLADFGCSKRLTEISTTTSHLIGTPVYMSPEFIRGRLHRKCDVWSLGCTLLELATAITPWAHANCRDHLPLMFFITTCSDHPWGRTRLSDWDLSPAFLNFLEATFERAVEKRPEVADLLTHPWMAEAGAESFDEGRRMLEEVAADMTTDTIATLLTQERDATSTLQENTSGHATPEPTSSVALGTAHVGASHSSGGSGVTGGESPAGTFPAPPVTSPPIPQPPKPPTVSPTLSPTSQVMGGVAPALPVSANNNGLNATSTTDRNGCASSGVLASSLSEGSFAGGRRRPTRVSFVSLRMMATASRGESVTSLSPAAALAAAVSSAAAAAAAASQHYSRVESQCLLVDPTNSTVRMVNVDDTHAEYPCDDEEDEEDVESCAGQRLGDLFSNFVAFHSSDDVGAGNAPPCGVPAAGMSPTLVSCMPSMSRPPPPPLKAVSNSTTNAKTPLMSPMASPTKDGGLAGARTSQVFPSVTSLDLGEGKTLRLQLDVTPTGHTGGPVRVSIHVPVSDLTLRVIERRPSYVLSMTDHVRAQISSAMDSLASMTMSNANLTDSRAGGGGADEERKGGPVSLSPPFSPPPPGRDSPHSGMLSMGRLKNGLDDADTTLEDEEGTRSPIISQRPATASPRSPGTSHLWDAVTEKDIKKRRVITIHRSEDE